MHKTELVRWVSKDTRLNQELVSQVLDSSLKLIQTALREGRQVIIPGFGSFYTRQREASRIINIKTKKPVSVPAMRVPAFRAGSLLKKAVRRKK